MANTLLNKTAISAILERLADDAGHAVRATAGEERWDQMQDKVYWTYSLKYLHSGDLFANVEVDCSVLDRALSYDEFATKVAKKYPGLFTPLPITTPLTPIELTAAEMVALYNGETVETRNAQGEKLKLHYRVMA
jgi:hypothetical protein